MKKKIMPVLAALMVLAMSTTVFAANSSTTDTAKGEALEKAVSETVVDGKKVETKAVTEKTVLDAAENAATTEKGTLKAVVDVTGITASKEKPVTITFTVPGVSGDVEVLHWDGAKWEKDSVSGVKVENGKVTATFTSLSPIAIVEKKAAENKPTTPPSNNNNTANTTTTATSPKTADVAPVLPMFAVICAAGAAVCAKKVKFNK